MRLEEKASEDATHKAFEATHIFSSMHSETEMVRYMTLSQHKDLYLTGLDDFFRIMQLA